MLSHLLSFSLYIWFLKIYSPQQPHGIRVMTAYLQMRKVRPQEVKKPGQGYHDEESPELGFKTGMKLCFVPKSVSKPLSPTLGSP